MPRKRKASKDARLTQKLRELKKQGKNDDYLKSYERGWHAAGKTTCVKS